jgi:hypothetical protein
MLVVLLKQANKKNESHLLDFGPIDGGTLDGGNALGFGLNR